MSYRLAMGTAAPIPPDDEGERMGVAEGHDRNYGRFLVASGPYMFEGSETMDFSADPKDQTEAPGYVPGRQIVLVRNPSYDPETDGLRDAFPDRIEVRIGGDNDDLYNQVAAGTLDFVVDGVVPAGEDPGLPDRPGSPGQDQHLRIGRDPVRVLQPGGSSVRRRPRPQGGQLGVRQAGVPTVAGWPVGR